MPGFLDSGRKEECFGCEACVNACSKNAITMKEDMEGFRYPLINSSLCTGCKSCRRACPAEGRFLRYDMDPYVFGGYSLDEKVRFESTSGGAFSAAADAFCDENYVIFGAAAEGIRVYHSYITDKRKLGRLRKSKYVQSMIGTSYRKVQQFLKEGKKVVFSGTPCQIAGLKAYLGNEEQGKLLTVEVVCEGVPSPLYVRMLNRHIREKCGGEIKKLDYRYKGKALLGKGRWDFQEMKIVIKKGRKAAAMKKDRWFNPFWSIWLGHLMSRPSCYQCPFAAAERTADITLGDLWGVHLYCPELYGENGGASLVVCNTNKGKQVWKKAEHAMYGHELKLEDALKYQSPMRRSIPENPLRGECMRDLESGMDYGRFTKKWAERPGLRLLWSKYIYGNRQKVWLWKLKNPEDGIL